MNIEIRFHRPYDRHPDDHFYGEPFDTELDKLIGSNDKWSSLRSERSQEPTATLKDVKGSISLHEIGPLIEFVVQNADQIPVYISALSAAVSAWAAVRATRKTELPANDYNSESGYRLKVDDIEVEVPREASKEEINDLLSTLVKCRNKHSTKKDT